MIIFRENMKVNIEEITKNVAQRKKWNSVPLTEIEFYERGVKINIPKKLMEEFMDIGLNNIDFIASGYYKENEKNI